LRLQQIIGQLLYYARCVDPTILTALSKLGSQQAFPTERSESAAERLLQYVASWPDAVITYRASDMRLIVYADASYLSESEGRSRAGGIHFLGTKGPPAAQPPNGTINCLSSIIRVVCSSAAEAEYASVFLNATLAESTRSTLTELGYPQDPTPILTDNAAAISLSNRSERHSRAKGTAIDMRFHWVRNRVAQGHFTVAWVPSAQNMADSMTKALPVHEHLRQREWLTRYLSHHGHTAPGF
jgi:hypothetical protein